MDSVNKTLYIPLYGKAFVSKKGIILDDKKAEEIWDLVKFPLKGKAKSKWLAYYMGMRSKVFDNFVEEKLSQNPNSIVLHLGCGLDSRVERVNKQNAMWFDIDFEAVVLERKRFYSQTENYKMVGADLTKNDFIKNLPKTDRAIVLLEGVSMYITNENLKQLFIALKEKYNNLSVLVDCYTPFAVKMSKLKNPVKSVGVQTVYGVENFNVLEENTGLSFVKEHEITPVHLINQLKGFEKFIFKIVYAGKTSKKLYKLYEYEG